MPPKAPFPPNPQTVFQYLKKQVIQWNDQRFRMKMSRNAPLSKGMVAIMSGSYIQIKWTCQDIQNLEPDHINLFPELAAIKKKVQLEWNEVLLEFERRSNKDTEETISGFKKNIPTLVPMVSSVKENTSPPAPPENQPSRPGLAADVGNHFRYENEGEKVPAMKTKNADKQVVEMKIDQQEQECHVKSDEEHGNRKPEESYYEEDQGKCFPKLPSMSEIDKDFQVSLLHQVVRYYGLPDSFPRF